jgi:1-acyl-sn-glycerol-3-phosphate acyltransferase
MLNKDPRFFSKSRVIISNHQSFIDILATSMLHPKIILLTNKWVWNSPVFGVVVKLADYYPVMEGVEESLGHLEKKAREGYSIMIFPEGTRSTDGKIRRFHSRGLLHCRKIKTGHPAVAY